MWLVKAEVNSNCDADRDRVALAHRWFEVVFADGFEDFFIEAHAESAKDARVLRIAMSVDDDGDHAHALIFGTSGFIGELRLRSQDRNRS